MKNVVGVMLILYILAGLALLVGWIMNIVAVAGSSFDPITGVVVLRVVGIFVPPLGGIMGLFV